MSFLSYSFLAALPLAAIIHAVLPAVWMKNAFLLIVSLLFYGSNGAECILVLALSTGITYAGGLLMAKSSGPRRKTVFLISLVLNLSILVVIKYTGFFISSLNQLLGLVQVGGLPVPAILQPIGLSFIIFQSCTYLFDLRAGKIDTERNLLRHALFVSFFPTLVCGPIQRAADFFPQLRDRKNPTFREAQGAVVLLLWGFFLKLVIADRIAMFTDLVFGNTEQYSGAVLLGGALLYSLQIYLDFAGYSWMAIGTARLFGFALKDNFRQPYLAVRMADFWRRWHISLTGWFTDYVYIPLGGNRKGAFRRYLNILIVFLISGLWHGASWTFVIWGALHAAYQIVGYLTARIRVGLLARLGIDPQSAAHRFFQRLLLFLLVSLAWVFFRSGTPAQALSYIRGIFLNLNPGALFDGTLFTAGLTIADWNLLVVCLLVVLAVSLLLEKAGRGSPGCLCSASAVLDRQSVLCRMLIILFLFTLIIIFGVYGEGYSASAFIYAGF